MVHNGFIGSMENAVYVVSLIVEKISKEAEWKYESGEGILAAKRLYEKCSCFYALLDVLGIVFAVV